MKFHTFSFLYNVSFPHQLYSLNGVLHSFQNYFSHINATVQILMYFHGSISTRLGLWSVLPQDTPHAKPVDPVGSIQGQPVARPTFYNWAMHHM